MESLTERAVLIADGMRVDFLEEARDELTGQSRRKWALLIVAFVLGAAAVLAAIVFDVRRSANVNISEATDENSAATSPDPAPTGG